MEENNGKVKYTLKVIALTALVTCLLTNTFKDVIYVRNNGKINNKVQKVSKIISDYSLFDIDEDKMADYAATGLAAAVDDHYTNYYNKEAFASFNTSLSNSFYGIGIVVSVDSSNNKLVVVSPVDGGPSANAGILSGDYIVAVDGVEYTGDQMSEAVSIMRGDVSAVGENVSVNFCNAAEHIYSLCSVKVLLKLCCVIYHSVALNRNSCAFFIIAPGHICGTDRHLCG